MKKFLSIIAATLLTLSLFAQNGATCDDAIYVESDYTGSFAPGEYWFMAMTSSLPISITYYPISPAAKAPEIQVDFTCTYENGEPVYDDPNVAKMVKSASKYDLSLPMTYTLTAGTDANNKLYYTYTFPKNYRNMLYGQGVTYAIPAYLKLKVYGAGTTEIASDAINVRCRDYVNTLGMNTTLLYTPEDSVNTYVWPLGEWIKYNYQITWTGNDRLYFYTSRECEFDRGSAKVRDTYILPDDELKMTTAKASDWVDDIFQTELYVHMYTKSDGYLKIAQYEENDNLTQYVISGLPAAIDNEKMTISALLPAGTDRNTAIQKAQYRPTKTHDGQTAVYNASYTTLTFGKLVYDLRGITVAEKVGNTDASLKSISIEGNALPDFSPYVMDYTDIEVAIDKIPVVTAEARKETSTVDIKQVTEVPGKAVITVTAEAGNTQTYTISFIRQRSTDNTLKALYVNDKPVPDFSRDTYHYRMEVMSLPVITAELNDAKATMVIDQPKRVPGFGQVIVTAENGEVEVYTINFVLNQEVKQCSNTTPAMNTSQTYTLKANEEVTYRVPVADWAGKHAVITWTGTEDLPISFMSTCLADDDVTFEQQTVSLEKGETVRHLYLSTTQTLRWKRQAVDGYTYLKFKPTSAGDVSIAPFSPSCFTRSEIFEVGTEKRIEATDFSKIFKVYLPDLQNKDTEFRWAGNSTFEIFIAEICDFYMVPNNMRVMREGNGEGYASLSHGQALKISKETAEMWLKWQRSSSEDFVYIRFNTGAAGTLSFNILKDYEEEKPCQPCDPECDPCNPQPDTYTLTLQAQPVNGGTFKGAGDYEKDSNVTFEAIANDHYSFRSWTDGNATNPRTVRLTQDMTFTAVFVADKHQLTLSCEPTQGRVSGGGRYSYGDEVEITATAFSGYRFAKWSDDNTDNPRQILIDGDIELTALFEVDDTAVEQISVTGNKARKIIYNGQVLILRDGKAYNVLGAEVDL